MRRGEGCPVFGCRILPWNDPEKETPFYVFKNKGVLRRMIN